MIELREAAFRGDVDTVNLFKRQGERINEAGPGTLRTALHWAALGGQNQVVSCLVKAAKAKVDPLDVDKNTPLNLAISAPNIPIARKLLIIDLLLTYGANPLVPNITGATPLMNLKRLSLEIPSGLVNHREVMTNIMRKVEKNIRQKAEELNRTFSISPDGSVVFEKISVPFTPPRESQMMRMRGF